MIPINKNLMFKILVGTFILIMIPTSMYPRLFGNGSGGGYEGDDGGTSPLAEYKSSDISIEMQVIEGAGYYLNAYSEILAFLNRVEESDLKGMDYGEAQQILDCALDNMNNAVNTYYYLIQRAEMTPYNEIVISKLMDFNYNVFMQQWELNDTVFKKVADYLKRGDINGMYKYIYTEFTSITKMLQFAKYELVLGRMPTLSNLWRINEICTHTMLFGQYTSRVFYAID